MKGVRVVASDKCPGLVEAVGEFYPQAAWRRCIVHSNRNVYTAAPKGKSRERRRCSRRFTPKRISHAAMAKGRDVAEKPRAMKLAKAADLAAESLGETPSYMAFPREHWRRIRTNNPLERIMKEIRRRTRVVGALPDGRSALRWVAAGLRDIAGTRWGTRRYMDMGRLREEESDMRMSQAGQVGRPFLPPGEGKAVEGGVTPRSF